MTPRHRGWLPHRRRLVRRTKRTILIVCEGKATEPNYFDGLKRVQRVMDDWAVTVKKGKGKSGLRVVQEAINRKNEAGGLYNETWCVLDTESLASPDAARDFGDAIAAAHQNNVAVAVSNPAFEVWFLAHFRRTSQHFPDADSVVQELNRFWKPSFHCDYDKTDRDVFARLAPRTDAAVGNAKTVRETDHRDKTHIAECNSATDVYLLVERLLGLEGG